MKTLGTLLTLSLVAGPVAADVVQLPADRDNTMYSESGDLSNGAGNSLFSGVTAQGSRRRALIRFDLSAIPAGSTIHGASLTLYMDMTISGAQSVALHRASQDWGEGSSHALAQEGAGAPATPGDATWQHTFWSGSFWTSAGGDFAATASATQSVAGNGFYTWSSAGMATDLQAWVDAPAANFGWVIKHASEAGTATAKRFASRTPNFAGEEPMLEVDFTPPPCAGTSYCSSTPNSTGGAALISILAGSSCVVAANDFSLRSTPVPNQPGIFFFSMGQTSGGAGLPFGNGLRCVGGGGFGIVRMPVTVASGLVATQQISFTSGPGTVITGGSTWNFQHWFRDPAGGGAFFDLSDGIEVTFQ